MRIAYSPGYEGGVEKGSCCWNVLFPPINGARFFSLALFRSLYRRSLWRGGGDGDRSPLHHGVWVLCCVLGLERVLLAY